MTTFRHFRHDRSVINARGGILPELADSLRAELLAMDKRDKARPERKGDELRRRREALGLTQVALARIVGCHENQISRIEIGITSADHSAITPRIEAALAAAEGERG